ncbi:MAG: CmcJ/NvfI family oxidoreductase [Gammaproteobacteria bacterium]|nr:CmcJ/NvfI family oxidoreductase [Gammaproteobacteria bacterium]
MSEPLSLSVETHLNGYFCADYKSPGKTIIDFTNLEPTEGVIPPVKSTVYDARELQESENDFDSNFESSFFDKHGFVLLPHESQVSNWDSGAYGQTDSIPVEDRNIALATGENEIEKYYMTEVEGLISTVLLPGKNLSIDQPNMLLRRGENTAHPYYGLGVHNDYGVTADDFQENMEAFSTPEAAERWRAQYEDENVREFMVINFWRPVHMSSPVEHMPLGVLDARSVNLEDLVSSGLKGFALTGKVTNQLSLRHNASQNWYYYPRMTVDEVLALKLFHIDKDVSDYRFGACYHSAFENPLAPKDAEVRQSCEHRVNVFVMRD